MNQNDHQFLIALGSNISLGRVQPLEIIKRAIAELRETHINSVVKVEANYSPHGILQKLHEIEEKFKRQRNSRWAARTLDLDLIAMKGQVLPSNEVFQYWFDLSLGEQKAKIPSELILPHPRIQDRVFVLSPLLDIEPNWIHPILNKTVVQLYEELPGQTKKDIQIVQ